MEDRAEKGEGQDHRETCIPTPRRLTSPIPEVWFPHFRFLASGFLPSGCCSVSLAHRVRGARRQRMRVVRLAVRHPGSLQAVQPGFLPPPAARGCGRPQMRRHVLLPDWMVDVQETCAVLRRPGEAERQV